MRTYKGNITKLKEGEVFVFGSNTEGFHGAGAAGFASFNEFGNVWRKYNYGEWENGKRGKWNIKGVGWGYQEGEEGASYAVATVKTIGSPMPRDLIKKQIYTFNYFAKGSSTKLFYVAQKAENGLCGWTWKQMQELWFDKIKWSDNVAFEENFIK